MGQSTDAILCFGVPLPEDLELPWQDDDEEDDADIEDWWRKLTGWVPPCEPFVDGEYAPGFSQNDPRIREYFDSRRRWLDQHPLPIELIGHCSSECRMYVVALPGTLRCASRGYPELIALSELLRETEVVPMSFYEFLDTHLPEWRDWCADGPQWILCSDWS